MKKHNPKKHPEHRRNWDPQTKSRRPAVYKTQGGVEPVDKIASAVHNKSMIKVPKFLRWAFKFDPEYASVTNMPHAFSLKGMFAFSVVNALLLAAPTPWFVKIIVIATLCFIGYAAHQQDQQ